MRYNTLILFGAPARVKGSFFFSSRRRHTRWNCDWSSRRVLFRSFITRALYEQAPTDDLLAGVLAHEIGHITGKHALNIIRRDELMSGGSSLLDKYSSDYREAKSQAGRSEERRVGKECRSR